MTEEKEIERALKAAHEAQRLATRRTELLLDVTADFSGAATMRQVEEALVSHLREFSMLLGKQAALAVPEQLTEVRSGRDLALQDYDQLPLPDQVLLDGLAAQCRAAAQRAHLMARTADIAEHLQLSLAASPLPVAEAFELAVHYAPGGDELKHVGGDWYDAVSTPSGSLAMIVGDVMGRGVLAATTMIRVRAGLRGLITVDPWPGHLLAFADELLVRDAPEQFVTAVAALLDPASGELHLCVAGHVPAIVVHPDGRTETLGTGTGIPLGIDPGVTRATQTSMGRSRVPSSCSSPMASWRPGRAASTRASRRFGTAPSSCATGRSPSWSPTSLPSPTRPCTTTSPCSPYAAADAVRLAVRNLPARGAFTVEDVVAQRGDVRRGMDDESDIYRRVVEATSDGLWMFDSWGVTTFANRRMAELLGRAPGDMLGFSALEGLDEEGRAQFREYLAELDAAPRRGRGRAGQRVPVVPTRWQHHLGGRQPQPGPRRRRPPDRLAAPGDRAHRAEAAAGLSCGTARSCWPPPRPSPRSAAGSGTSPRTRVDLVRPALRRVLQHQPTRSSTTTCGPRSSSSSIPRTESRSSKPRYRASDVPQAIEDEFFLWDGRIIRNGRRGNVGSAASADVERGRGGSPGEGMGGTAQDITERVLRGPQNAADATRRLFLLQTMATAANQTQQPSTRPGVGLAAYGVPEFTTWQPMVSLPRHRRAGLGKGIQTCVMTSATWPPPEPDRDLAETRHAQQGYRRVAPRVAGHEDTH